MRLSFHVSQKVLRWIGYGCSSAIAPWCEESYKNKNKKKNYPRAESKNKLLTFFY